jgi:glycosyltransferase involved in cell wall biosynthesis
VIGADSRVTESEKMAGTVAYPTAHHKVGLLTYELLPQSGETRQALNIASALSSKGFEVTLFSLSADASVVDRCQRLGLKLVSGPSQSLSGLDKWRLMLYSDKLARRLVRVMAREPHCDTYIVVQDAAAPVANERLPGRTVYLCCGDMSLLLLDSAFRKRHGTPARVLSLSVARHFESHADAVRRFDVLLANSQFTRGVMSYLYNVPIAGVVYPPVDLQLFQPMPKPAKGAPNGLAILRSSAEPAFPLVSRAAALGFVKVVGAAKVPGSTQLGVVTDAMLVSEYSSATVNLSPNLREFFGYSIVEAAACGTPTIAFDQGGAREIVSDGSTGWLVRSEAEFLSRFKECLTTGFPPGIRTACQVSAQRFSLPSAAVALEQFIGH